MTVRHRSAFVDPEKISVLSGSTFNFNLTNSYLTKGLTLPKFGEKYVGITKFDLCRLSLNFAPISCNQAVNEILKQQKAML